LDLLGRCIGPDTEEAVEGVRAADGPVCFVEGVEEVGEDDEGVDAATVGCEEGSAGLGLGCAGADGEAVVEGLGVGCYKL